MPSGIFGASQTTPVQASLVEEDKKWYNPLTGQYIDHDGTKVIAHVYLSMSNNEKSYKARKRAYKRAKKRSPQA